MDSSRPLSTPDWYALTLLRHGESVGNAESRFQGQADYPLTETGHAQANCLAKRWVREKRSFDRFIVSPLMRARQTAEIITGALNIPMDLDPIWMERDFGDMTGLRYEDATKRFPHLTILNLHMLIGHTGEGEWQLYLRAAQALQSLRKRPSGRYCIVSHGGLLNKVLYVILGITPHASFQGPSFAFGNTGFTDLIYQGIEDQWRVLGFNDLHHLADLSRAPRNAQDQLQDPSNEVNRHTEN